MYRRSNNFKLPNKRNVRYGTYTVIERAEGVTMLENALLKMIFEFKDVYAHMRVSSKQSPEWHIHNSTNKYTNFEEAL